MSKAQPIELPVLPPGHVIGQVVYDEAVIQEAADHWEVNSGDICCICLAIITTMAFKGTGVCCELHRKDRDNDHAPAGTTVEAANFAQAVRRADDRNASRSPRLVVEKSRGKRGVKSA